MNTTKYYRTNKVLLETDSNEYQKGDILKIANKKKYCGAIVESVKSGNGYIQMDKIILNNLDVELGDTVEIEKISPKNAEIIEIEITKKYLYILEKIKQLFKTTLVNQPIFINNKLPIDLGQKEEFFQIMSTVPKGVVIINENTRIERYKKNKDDDKKTIITNTTLLHDDLPSILFEKPQVSFEDIGGLESVKRKLLLYVNIFRDSSTAKEMGVKSANIIFFGQPGTGKTLLAKAFAKECNSNFISITPADILSKWIGVGPQFIQKVFLTAKSNAPCIIFIDEFESVAHKRYEGDHTNDIVNQLLIELNNIKDVEDVLVIAATNKIELIDDAFFRRFPIQLEVALPDENSRRQIFEIFLLKKPTEKDILGQLVELTEGFSGSDIESICNDAAVEAVSEKCKEISLRHFKKSIKEYSSHKRHIDGNRNMYI